ncbi:GntR family transcriptional regulator [Rhodobacteraceae bacterium D3-12]|nr:GntR family transcriptional regulator [Rhodobacteraceae bacterium D3-12]
MAATDPKADTPQAEIYNRIWLSIAERKLKPGTRLKEEKLAEIFSVSRARVRRALATLAHEGLVTLVPNRGAFVSQPSAEEARDIFFARRTIEASLVARLCEAATPEALEKLEAHVAQEWAARDAGDIKASIRLSGGFHALIGELAGSPYLWDVLRDLVSRTSLIMAMYQTRSQTHCGPDEHADVVASIREGDALRAQELMNHHIDHLEEQLDLEDDSETTDDLKDILL